MRTGSWLDPQPLFPTLTVVQMEGGSISPVAACLKLDGGSAANNVNDSSTSASQLTDVPIAIRGGLPVVSVFTYPPERSGAGENRPITWGRKGNSSAVLAWLARLAKSRVQVA